MNLRNVAFEMPMRSSRSDSYVASMRLRFERIREHVGFCRRSEASRIGKASQHESEDAQTQSARPSEHVDSTANLRCFSAAVTRVQTDGGQLRMKLFANSCSDLYLAGGFEDVTCWNPFVGGNDARSLFYANSLRFRAVEVRNSRCFHSLLWFHRIILSETLGSLCRQPQQSEIENRIPKILCPNE